MPKCATDVISIVVPVFNEQAYIRQCLDALMSQTIQPTAIYIVDNNSTDNTIEIATQYPKVKIITESVQGICAATKAGLDAAAKDGGLLLRCDADSRPQPQWIETILRSFQDNTRSVAITGPGAPYDAGRFGKLLFSIFYMKPYFFFTTLALGYTPLFGSNFAVKATAWKSVSRHTHLASHQNIHDDIDISYHLAGSGDIHYEEMLVMPISARPFRSPQKMPARYAAGFRSIFLHWPTQAPWRRYLK